RYHRKAQANSNVPRYGATYDGRPHPPSFRARRSSDQSLAGLDVSATTHTSAGNYNGDPWTFTDVTGNYNNTSGAVNDYIGKANATINLTPYRHTHNDSAHTATRSATDGNGETLSGLDL